eukprot:6189519-Pleurochrysis_carterae.AAC.3
MVSSGALCTLRLFVWGLCLAAFRATIVPLEEIECTYELQVEDNVDNEGTFRDEILYGKCTLITTGEVVYIPDEMQASQYAHGDHLVILVKPYTRISVATATGAASDWSQADNRQVDVVRTIKQTSLKTPPPVVRAFAIRYQPLANHELSFPVSPAFQPTTAAAPMLRTVIVMRLIYKNASPTYCDKKCVMDGLFDGMTIASGSVKGIVVGDCTVNGGSQTERNQLLISASKSSPVFCTQGLLLASSYGTFSFSRSNSRVVDVYMNKDVPVTSDACPVGVEADRADSIVRASGIDPKSFTHREYFVPSPFGALDGIVHASHLS